MSTFCKSLYKRGGGGMRCKGRLVHLLLNLQFLHINNQVVQVPFMSQMLISLALLLWSSFSRLQGFRQSLTVTAN